MEIKADIVDYMGKYEDGVLVLLSINCNGSFTEGTVFYTNDNLVLTVDQSIEELLGGPIETWVGYKSLLESIFIKLVPCSEVIGRLDDINLDSYVEAPSESMYIDDEVNPDDIIFATASNLS